MNYTALEVESGGGIQVGAAIQLVPWYPTPHHVVAHMQMFPRCYGPQGRHDWMVVSDDKWVIPTYTFFMEPSGLARALFSMS